MTWLAIIDPVRGRFLRDPQSVGSSAMAQGSLVIETQLSADPRPTMLFGLDNSSDPNGTKLSLASLPGGGLSLVVSGRSRVFHKSICHDGDARAEKLRLTYSWGLPDGRGRIAIEHPAKNRVDLWHCEDAMPMTMADIFAGTQRDRRCHVAPDVAFAAFSDRIETVGPMPTLSPDTPILTPEGHRPIADIHRGGLVVTLDGRSVPVLSAVRRTVPAFGLFAPVRLRQPYFGLQQDVVVAPTQRLVVGGSRVEYLFGQEQVLASARHLCTRAMAVRQPARDVVTYMQLVLPDHDAICAAGTWMESLNIGRIRRKADVLAASVLAGTDRASLPDHARPAIRPLSGYEAVTLAEARVA